MWLQSPISVSRSDRFQVGMLPGSLPSMLPPALLREDSLPSAPLLLLSCLLSCVLSCFFPSFLLASGRRSGRGFFGSSSIDLPDFFFKKKWLFF